MTTAASTPTSAASLDFDRRRADGRGIADSARAFSTAAKLGWQMEANWTDPLLFFIYSIAKPIASALILVFMLLVIAGPGASEARAFVIVGSALWAFVMSGMAGLAWSVLDDRERYRMLKYIYVSPSDFKVVLMGRGVARIAIGAMGALIVLVFGIIFLGVPFAFGAVDWPLLAIDLAVGLTAIVAIGIVMAAICLQTRQESWSYPEAVAGAMFLVVAAVFPLSVLPHARPGHRAAGPADLVARRRPTGGLPGQPDRHRRGRLAVDQPDGHPRSRPRDDRGRVAGHDARGYTRGLGRLPLE